MPLTGYLKIPDIDGESKEAFTESDTLQLPDGQLGLLDALVEEGYTFSASSFDFENIKIKYGDGEPPEIDPGPIIVDPGGPGGPKEIVKPDYGPTDTFVFIKIDSGFDGDSPEGSLEEFVDDYLTDYKLISAGERVFIKLEMNIQNAEVVDKADPDIPDQALDALPDDFFW